MAAISPNNDNFKRITQLTEMIKEVEKTLNIITNDSLKRIEEIRNQFQELVEEAHTSVQKVHTVIPNFLKINDNFLELVNCMEKGKPINEEQLGEIQSKIESIIKELKPFQKVNDNEKTYSS